MQKSIVIDCPYLGRKVELSPERVEHIAERHPDLLPVFLLQLIETVEDPDQVRSDGRYAGTRLFTKWYDDVRDGKYIVVVVVSENDVRERHWIVTAYMTRRLSQGSVEWTRN